METAVNHNVQKNRIEPERHVLGAPIVYRLGIWGAGYLPKWLSYWFARRIADISYLFYAKARENVKKNLKLVFPDLSERDMSRLAVKTFRNYSAYLVDYGRFKSIEKDSLLDVMADIKGGENIENAFKRRKGIILLTAHLGNWELGGIFFGRQDMKINVLTFRDGIEKIDAIKEMYRKHHNINTIVLGDSPFAAVEIVNALQRNEIVAMLVDRQSNGMGSVNINIFGKPSYFPSGPLILARTTGAAIISGFVVKTGKKYRAIAEEPIFIGHNEDIETYAQRIADTFEDYIRQYPDQWYNFVEI